MPFSAGERRQDSYWRIRSHGSCAAGHLLDRRLPRGGSWIPGEFFVAVLTTNSDANETKQVISPSKDSVVLGILAWRWRDGFRRPGSGYEHAPAGRDKCAAESRYPPA